MPQSFRADSREVERGGVFIAMRGERTDGHEYIEDAVRRGASVVILEEGWYWRNAEGLKDLGASVIPVEDPERSVALLAERWLGMVSPKVVGITGSVGKTTTRELLHGAIKDHMRAHSAVKSYNTMIGCSMTVLSMPGDTETLILELGTNHPGEIRAMVGKFPVTHGVITEITEVHLDGLKSIDGVLAAKMELTDSRDLEFLSYNNDNEALSAAVSSIRRPLRVVSVGARRSDVTVSDIKQSIGEDGTPLLSLVISSRGEDLRCEARFFGVQHAKNIAYAYSAARDLGVPGEIFADAVRRVDAPRGRGRIFRTADGMIIDETYNASPGSMSYALKNVLGIELAGDVRKIAILGGMRELGAESDRWHEVIMSRASLFDEVYLIGSEWDGVETKQGALRGRWRDADGFLNDFDPASASGAIVLVKGSRSYGLERILPLLGVV
jgi:UDP-N-acetylmuramoyl-tripeptide--D-alanyl-D-alanine ligase